MDGTIPVVFCPGMAGQPCPTHASLDRPRPPALVRRPCPSKEKRQASQRDDLGPPVVPGGEEIGLGSRNLGPRAVARLTWRAVSRERLGVWDGPMAV